MIGASTTEAGTLVGPGVVQHVGTAPTAFYFGELDGKPSARVAALVDAFNKAGFGAREAADIRHVEWEKLLQITVLCAWSVSALGVMPGGSVAEALVVREAAEHYLAIARELLAVYRSLGYEPQDFFAPYSRFRELARETDEQAVEALRAQGQRMLDAGVIGRPSLHVDLMRGRPTEVEYCLGPFLAQAERAGIAVPTARAGYRIIRTLEQMLDSNGEAERMLDRGELDATRIPTSSRRRSRASKRSARTARRASRARAGSSRASATTTGWRATSPCAIPSTPTASG